MKLWPRAQVGEPWRLKNAVPGSATTTDTCTVDDDGVATFDGASHNVPYVAGGLVTENPPVVSVSGATDTWTVTLAYATGGDFTITADDGTNPAVESDPIAFDATSNDVKAAVDAALSVTDTEVVGDAGGPWTVTFGTAPADDPTADGAGLEGVSEWRFLACSTGNYVAPDRIPHPYGS